MTRVKEIVSALEAFAPLRLAEDWDNVGLLVGDPEAEAKRVLLCIDYTRAVAEEAEPGDLVVAYHPPIFQGMKRVPAGSEVFRAIQRGVALYSPHTALDAAKGGTNDALADAIGLTDTRPLRPSTAAEELKLVTFVPADALDKVSQALFAAGAGVIGNYAQCSFRTEGTGTFFGDESTDPQVGSKGQLETVREVRLETLVPGKKLAAVVQALRASHPYETPAFDLVRLAAAPEPTLGQGRIGTFTGSRKELVERTKLGLSLSHVLVAGALDGRCKTVAVAAGAGAALIDDAVKAKADVLVTGELKHHDALRCQSRGLAVVMTLHSNSERIALAALGKVITGAPVVHSRSDRDPYTVL